MIGMTGVYLGGLSTHDDTDNDADTERWHTTNNSWLRRLFGIYAKLVKNPRAFRALRQA